VIWLSLLSYTADLAIIGTYFLLARTGKVRAFHWANALGCFPLLAGEVIVRAWPVFPVTAFFGLAGWYGLWVERRKAKREAEYIKLYDTQAVITGMRVMTSPYVPRGAVFIMQDPGQLLPQLDPNWRRHD
jgi:hypothetical protein